jgi:hypothetical protein
VQSDLEALEEVGKFIGLKSDANGWKEDETALRGACLHAQLCELVVRRLRAS